MTSNYKTYQEHSKEIAKVERKIEDIVAGKAKALAEVEILTKKVQEADEVRLKTLEKFALGEGSPAAVGETEDLLHKLQTELSRKNEILTILEKNFNQSRDRLKDLTKQFHESEKLLWRTVANNFSEEIKEALGRNFEKFFIACKFGGLSPVLIFSKFLNDFMLAGQALPPDRVKNIAEEILKNYK